MQKSIFVIGLVAAFTALPAAAAPVTVGFGGASFFDAPVSYDFGGGNSVSFSTVDKSFFAFNPAGVATTGTARVLSLGAPFFDPPQPTSFFLDRGGSIGPDTLGVFAAYATPAPIPFSITRGLVGLSFDLGQGVQYGYADIEGSTLYGLRFESTPGEGIALGAVPEPATWALLIGGFGMVGTALRRRRSVTA